MIGLPAKDLGIGRKIAMEAGGQFQRHLDRFVVGDGA